MKIKDILLVEDDQSVKVLEELMLKSKDYSFDSVDNSVDACRLLKDTYYKVIILDIRLDEPARRVDFERCDSVNGVELCLKIREAETQGLRPPAKIFAITGLKTLTTQANLCIAGFDAVFDKPFDWPAMFDAINLEV